MEKLLDDPTIDLLAEQNLAAEEPEIYHLFPLGNLSYKGNQHKVVQGFAYSAAAASEDTDICTEWIKIIR